MAQPWAVPGGLVQRGAQQGDLGKVVEVPGLERRILAIVGEAEELRAPVEVRSRCNSIGPDGKMWGGTAVIHAQRRQLGAFER